MFKKYLNMIRADIKDAMSRRCGLDELNNLLMLIGFVYVVVALFTHKWIFTLIGAIFVILCYVRVFSKNIEQRRKENDFYMRYMGSVVRFFEKQKYRIKLWIRSRKDAEHIYFLCKCGQTIRLPKGKNKISVRCPKCGHNYIKRT